MTNHRWSLVAFGCIAATALASAQPAAAQQYPTKAIKMIIPYSAGTGIDGLLRAISQQIAKDWMQPVIVENRPGANSIVGGEACAKFPPDGYTFCLLSGTVPTLPYLYSKLPFDPVKDFEPVTNLVFQTTVLVVNSAIPVNSVSELVAYVKAKPGALNYNTLGAGGIQHLWMERFKRDNDIDIVHVPYQPQAIVQAVVTGDVHVTYYGLQNLLSQIRAGRVRALAVSGDKRSALLPGVPTLAEAGVKELYDRGWYGLFAPAGTPKDIVLLMQREVAKVFALPEFRERVLTAQALLPAVNSPDEFAQFLRVDRENAAAAVKISGARLE